MVEIVRSYTNKARGKFCHFLKDDFFRHNLGQYYWLPKVEGFVFYGAIEYKAQFKFGCLSEFAVQYKHIL